MKKILALILTLTMILSLAACGNTKGEDTGEETETTTETETAANTVETPEVKTDAEIGGYKIGFFYLPDSDGLSRQYREALTYCVELTNCEIETVDIFTASSDEVTAAIETLASNGCDGIIIVVGNSPALFEYLNEKGVYYCGMTRSHTEEVALVTDESEYCTGWIDEDTGLNYNMGYNMAKALADKGAEKIAYVLGAPGMSMIDERVRGIEAGAKDLGMEILTSYRGSDYAAGFSDILSSYGSELDGIVANVSEDVGVAAINAAGLSDSILYAQFDALSNTQEYFETGRIAGVCAGNNVFIVEMYMQLFNAISGADRLFNEGEKVIPVVPNFPVVSAEQWEMAEKYTQGAVPGLTPDELLALCSHYAPETTVEEKEALLEKYCSSEYWNIEAIAERVSAYLGE